MLTLQGLKKQYRDHTAVDNFTLQIEPGEFIALLGPSGSGKTTVLRMIAGLTHPSAGKIVLDNKDITNLAAQKRNLGVVFQSYALFPHLTAKENISFPLKVRKWNSAEIGKRVEELLEIVQLRHREHYYPDQMSGGENQRIALARALAFNPPVLLLDEPLSALDAKVRSNLREMLKDIQKQLGITTLMVTHDQDEALTLADRIVVMQSGRIEQTGIPRDVYESPKTKFVAHFVGETSQISIKAADQVTIFEENSVSEVTWGRYRFHWMLSHREISELKTIGQAELYIRPESVKILPEPGTNQEPMATVRSVTYLGKEFLINLTTDTGEVIKAILPSDAFIPQAADTVYIHIADPRVGLHSPKWRLS